MIALTPVLKSANIEAIGHAATEGILAIAFKPSGTVWHYRVSETVGEMMMGVAARANEAAESNLAMDEDETPSVGRAFYAMVMGKYDGEKIV